MHFKKGANFLPITRRRAAALCAVTGALVAAACSESDNGGTTQSGTGGGTTIAGTGGSGGGAAPAAQGGKTAASGGSTSMGAATSTGGTPPAGGQAGVPGGTSATGGTVSAGGASTGGSTPVAGGPAAGAPSAGAGGGGTPPVMDHCKYGYDPHPTDETMKAGPALFFPPGKEGDMSIVDTTLQPEVLAWMKENVWPGAHVEWHAIRGCKGGFGDAASHVNICSFTELIPANQTCQNAGDGYEFLLFHRHMIQALKQLWPKHAADFDGFPTFPQTAEELPEPWRASWKNWAEDANGQQILAAAKIGDEIDKPENLAKFASEGEVGYWLQCNVGARALTNTMPWVGLHFVLHDKWTRAGNRTHGLNNTEVNVENYMFWKLHGWIDNVWEKYRVAKGITSDPAQMEKYRADLYAQCDEMDKEIRIIKENLKPGDDLDPDPLPTETGYFHEKVRPLLESEANRCVSCHADVGGQLGVPMVLGGNISSKKIVEGLMKDAAHAPGFKLVVPGNPEKSWLYLKIADTAKDAGCVITDPQNMDQCNTARMPPTGMVSAADLEVIRKWIADGAPPPP
jgi:hypothetical protein